MIANGVADSLTKFLCDSLCNVDSCQSTGLGADDLNFLLPVHAALKNVLGHLGSLTTASVT